ncbi:MAG TPA: NADH-quinone oxidoreductase subunit NuoE [Dehalococcoidales bacterium]|nr:NADH-quinone oxidoreductase subunit NuoE [Dehalococcoidales bacterium]
METSEIEKKVDEILSSFKKDRYELINILQQIQRTFYYLPEPAMKKTASFLGISVSQVYGVATFYAYFRTEPSGKHTICVCRGTACHVRGANAILREIEKKLGIKSGQTTPDMEYTLIKIACIGACALAPNITIDKETYGLMTGKRVEEVFGGYKKSE